MSFARAQNRTTGGGVAPPAAGRKPAAAASGNHFLLRHPVAGTATPSRMTIQRKCDGCEDNDKKLQTKLAVSEPGDALEQEADAVADGVMRMAAPPVHAAAPAVMREASGTAPATAPPSVQAAMHTPGVPLDAATRAFMEPRFGADFGGVRIHTGAAAEQSARDVRARAYTVGSGIVFGAGQFEPRSDSGRRLLAHELTHVVQQANSIDV
jgi:hypothetical protein